MAYFDCGAIAGCKGDAVGQLTRNCSDNRFKKPVGSRGGCSGGSVLVVAVTDVTATSRASHASAIAETVPEAAWGRRDERG